MFVGMNGTECLALLIVVHVGVLEGVVEKSVEVAGVSAGRDAESRQVQVRCTAVNVQYLDNVQSFVTSCYVSDVTSTL